MVVNHSSPRSLGVESLMYVGDDGVPAAPAKTFGHATAGQYAAGTIGIALMLFSKRPLLRAAGGVVAAVTLMHDMGW